MTQVVRVVESSGSVYRGLAWRKKSEDLAVLRTVADKGFRDTTHALLAWLNAPGATPTRREMDPANAPGFTAGMRVAEARRPEWTDDGSTVFFGLREREAADSAARGRAGDASPKVSDVQVWHSQDVRIMPMQKVQESQDLQRTLPAGGTWRAEGRADLSNLMDDRVLPGGKRHEGDRSAYAWGTMFGRPYQDGWVVDVRTGQRSKALEKCATSRSESSGRCLAVRWHQLLEPRHRDGCAPSQRRGQASFADVDWDYPGDMTPPEGKQAGRRTNAHSRVRHV
jgi:hypothetical protein